ncbi:hypothetical protein K493DRAFT_103109 [Basidiobolus meristosporus CBS 931.73]|uniref:Uncharacterized protein n=1 Tax=Basidiobolus meristosporus CBS 931.73 TaxID=1314790 RepID=A0A1Y1YR80_9FUNG|nr:hypothetical protein K493DRAFT_103109 [Basidiobolus meristosporus CBS 931.73]|eukprot:ORY00476.1 hypothetical protein K493DRAFT_103109 [Basidiobolus meristosporus CBS 931.73]
MDDKERYRQALGTLGEELTDEEYGNLAKPRVRSQSSFGTYHFPPQSSFPSEPALAPPGFGNDREDRVSDLHPLWGSQDVSKDPVSMYRRRSIANPVGFGNMWEKNTSTGSLSSGFGGYTQALNAERLNRLQQQRRYSLAPPPSFQEAQLSDPLQDMLMSNR